MSESTPHTDLARPRTARLVALMVGVLVAFLVTVSGPVPVSAHTGFESSTPAEGATVDAPLELVTLVFTGEATPVGDQIVALTPDGVVQEAANIATVDDKIFSVRFDPPLAGGRNGIRWSVQAADAHPIEGAFAFTVNAPATTAVAEEPSGSEFGGGIDSSATDSAIAGSSESGATAQQSFDEFLTVDDSAPGETTATVGRIVGFLGVTIGLGAFAFVATALRGRRHEVRHVINGVRALGLVIVAGSAIEYVGVARIAGEALTSSWSTAHGFATVMRMIGGVGLAVGVAGMISRGVNQRLVRRPSVARSLSSAVLDDIRTEPTGTRIESLIVRWTPTAQSWPSLVGIVLIVVSFWFDGHTVSKGFRPLHDFVNSVHVVAGAVWVGGVVTMAAIIWSRHRSGEPMRVVELVVRFSKVATIALVSVVVAGGVMAILVLDSPGELFSTQWGKMLLLKSAAVVLASIGGAYNHFRLLPALENDPESPELLAELRSTVTAEAMMLTFVVIVTASLVAAAS